MTCIARGVRLIEPYTLNPIAANIHDKYSVAPSIRSLCTRCCYTMTNMIQVCRKFHESRVFVTYTPPLSPSIHHTGMKSCTPGVAVGRRWTLRICGRRSSIANAPNPILSSLRTGAPPSPPRIPSSQNSPIPSSQPSPIASPLSTSTLPTALMISLDLNRGASLIRNSAPLGTYSRNMPRPLWWSLGGGGGWFV